LEVEMSKFEIVSRSYALGKLGNVADKPKRLKNFLIYAYLGRLVMLINQYQKKQVTEGPAMSQFLDLACLIKEETGEDVVDKVFSDLSLLVDKRLDCFEDSITVMERRQISSTVATMVPY
jgi:hypothetical protein